MVIEYSIKNLEIFLKQTYEASINNFNNLACLGNNHIQEGAR